MSTEPNQVDFEGKNARDLHNSGGKCYAIQDYSSAVQYLSRASELGVKEYGDPLHDKMGEIYLMYGKSLLELTREEGDPLGENVPKDVPVGEEEAEEEEDEVGEESEDQGEEGEDGEDQEDGDEDEVEKEESENVKNEEEEKKIDEGAGGVEFNGEKGDEIEDEGDKEEEPSDLQVAWEILELAKVIFTQRGESGKGYLADTLITLGEISMESENVEAAINDIKEAVEILKSIQDGNSRVLAEAYYKLGMAITMDNKIDEAIEQYNKSKEILENRIKELEKSERALHKKEVEDMKKYCSLFTHTAL